MSAKTPIGGEPKRADTPTLVAELVRQLAEAAEADTTATTARPRGRGELVRRNDTDVVLRAARVARIEAGRRARRLPYLTTGATGAAGYAGWGLAELAAFTAGTGGHVAAVAGAAALSATTLASLRISFRDRIAAQWRRRWSLAGTGAAAWVTTATAIGPTSWPMTACLTAGAAAASIGWLREHEVPRPTPGRPSLPPAAPSDDDLGELLTQRWATNIAAPRGVIPGALLTDRRDYPRAIRWTVQTKPGSMDFSELFNRRGRLSAGLQVSATKVILEPSEEDESWAELTVITRDLLAKGIPYTGPRYHDGRVPLGPFADGTGEAEYVAYDEVGCRNGMATGEPGSGKSAFLEAVGLGLKSSGEWVVWFGDGDPEGGSSPVLNEVADWAAAGPQGVLAQLEALEAALEIRSLLKSTLTAGEDGSPIPITDPSTQRPIRELRPCRAFPAVKWILDELHRLTSDPWLIEHRFVQRLEKLVRIGRKYGIVVLTGSQSLLAPDYGNSTTLRGYLAAKNLFAFRNKNRTETAVVGGLAIAPGTLPAGGGYAFATESGRLSMMRVAWERDLGRHAPGLPTTSLDHDTDLATAPLRPATPRDPASVYAAQVQRLQHWRARQQLTTGAASACPPEPATVAAPALSAAPLARLRVPPALTASNVIPINRAPAETRLAHASVAPDLDVLNPTQRAVYDALINGSQRTGEIVTVTGLKAPAVSKSLAALAELSLARKLAHGHWQPTTGSAQTG